MRYSTMKTIVYTPQALKQFADLPAEAQSQIDQALDLYALEGRGDVKALAGRAGFRLRVGRYRVIFDEDRQTILAIYIGKRDTSTYARH